MDESPENTALVKNAKNDHVYTSKTDGEAAKPMKEATEISKTEQTEGVSMAENDLVAGPSTADDVTSSLGAGKIKNSKKRKAEKDDDVLSAKTDAKIKSTKKVTSNFKISKSKDAPVVEKELVVGPTIAGEAASRKVRDKNASAKNAKKDAIHPPVSEMVLETLKTLKKRNGASVEQISGYIGENYQVNVKMLKSHINKFLRKSEEGGILEKVAGANAEEKFKIKKEVSAGKGKQDLISKKRKVVLVKKAPVQKRQRKK